MSRSFCTPEERAVLDAVDEIDAWFAGRMMLARDHETARPFLDPIQRLITARRITARLAEQKRASHGHSDAGAAPAAWGDDSTGAAPR